MQPLVWRGGGGVTLPHSGIRAQAIIRLPHLFTQPVVVELGLTLCGLKDGRYVVSESPDQTLTTGWSIWVQEYIT